MPRYIYIAKSTPDKTTEGYVEANSQQEAVEKLTQMGYFPLSVKSESSFLDKHGFIFLRKISRSDIVLFTRQLSSLIESGVNILNALDIIGNQTPNNNLRIVLNELASRIKDGNSLSESLKAFPDLFSEFYQAMIHSGEASGEMTIVLKRLADFLEEEEEFRGSLRSSLIYPFFIFVVSMLTVIILFVFVIPRLVTMFEDMGQVLPLPTRILITISSAVQHYWFYITVFFLTAIFILRRFLVSPLGSQVWDEWKLRLGFIREIVLKSQISRMARTLSILLSSGVAITPALEISAGIMDNQVLRREVLRFKDEIASGGSLSTSLKKSVYFPAFVTNIVVVGEETGSLDKALLRVAVDYEREVGRILSNFTRLIEPVIILAMGLVVGFIVISMLLPIFQINLIVK